ncbi:MAG TPA: ATP-binding protein, partial [Solirubrobacteraceae bacterium]|nr:ATP-binding protein [Solirubrobacteraceae bacterium]
APAACREVLMVAREALRNVEQHARAARVDVRLRREGDALVLEIADDGCGVPVATGSGGRFSRVKERPGHFGIVGMRERAAVAGGTLVVHPRPEGGTAVVARLPLGASEEVSPA